MATSQPIRKKTDIEKLKNYFLERGEYRNYALVTFGLNTALRISDILKIKWGDVYDSNTHSFLTHIHLIEQKTQKETYILVNKSVKKALIQYKNTLDAIRPEEYIFSSQKNRSLPISRVQAFRIIKEAVDALNLGEHISCHSLRKTFGYQAWKEGAEPALLMNIFNHSSFEITKRYLCIDQDDKDKLFYRINL